MTSEKILAVLRAHADELRAPGIVHAALFGSTSRGDAGPNSDVDILIELDPELKLGIFEYAGLKRQVSDLFVGLVVDVVDKAALRPHLREPVTANAIYAF